MKTAIVIGATGLTGSLLLGKLLAHPDYSRIIIFTRKSTNLIHHKLTEVICDVLKIKEQNKLFKADEVFCCIGTTAKKAPNKTIYKSIDYGIPLQCAVLCKENDIQRLMIISALGVDANSAIFYNRIKGEMERDVLGVLPHDITFLQPSLILGNRGEVRIGEQIGVVLMKGLSFAMLGPLKKYRAIQADTIANAMVSLAQLDKLNTYYTSEEIERIGIK